MTVSSLTTGESDLYAQAIASLTDYPFNSRTTSLVQYFATVASGLTGGSYSHLQYSEEQLLAIIATDVSGSTVSASSTTVDDMLVAIISAGGGGAGDALLLETGDFILLESGDHLLLDA